MAEDPSSATDLARPSPFERSASQKAAQLRAGRSRVTFRDAPAAVIKATTGAIAAVGSAIANTLFRWPTGMDPDRAMVSDLTDFFMPKWADEQQETGLQLVEAGLFRDFGGKLSFQGVVTTIKAIDANQLVRKTLNEDGHGRVLVIDGDGRKICALFGDRLGKLAEQRGWAGVIVNGAIRDSYDLKTFDVGVKALFAHPIKPGKKGLNERDVPVTFGGVTIKPGDWVYADEDGILVAPHELVLPDEPRPEGGMGLTIPE